MSTYWYLDVDAPLRVDEPAAREAFGRALADLGHHLSDDGPHYPELVADRLPYRVAGEDERPCAALPDDGWTIAGGRLVASLFVENLTRPVDGRAGDGGHVLLLACLSEILDVEPGIVVGGLASENAECKGPLIRVGDVVRWLPSTASHPGRGYDLGPDLDPVERIPPDLLSDAGDGLTCKADVDVLIRRIEAITA